MESENKIPKNLVDEAEKIINRHFTASKTAAKYSSNAKTRPPRQLENSKIEKVKPVRQAEKPAHITQSTTFSFGLNLALLISVLIVASMLAFTLF